MFCTLSIPDISPSAWACVYYSSPTHPHLHIWPRWTTVAANEWSAAFLRKAFKFCLILSLSNASLSKALIPYNQHHPILITFIVSELRPFTEEFSGCQQIYVAPKQTLNSFFLREKVEMKGSWTLKGVGRLLVWCEHSRSWNHLCLRACSRPTGKSQPHTPTEKQIDTK